MPRRLSNMTRGTVLCTALLLSGLTAKSAMAAGAADKAAAEALFDEGVKLLKENQLEEACKKLESSQRIDPGIGTLLYLGECYEKSGRTASAWATFREAASVAQAAGQSDRARIGTARAEKLAASLSRITIQMPDDNMSIAELEVSSDGIVITRGLWGTAVPIDPGEHKIVAKAPGYEPIETMVTVAAGGSNQVLTLGLMQKLPEEPKAEPLASPAPSAEPKEAPYLDPNRGDQQRTWGLVSLGIGVVGLGLGATMGLLAIDQNDKATTGGCDKTSCPDDETAGFASTARDFATGADIGLIAGGALAALGATLYLTAPERPESVSLRLGPTRGGAQLLWGGQF